MFAPDPPPPSPPRKKRNGDRAHHGWILMVGVFHVFVAPFFSRSVPTRGFFVASDIRTGTDAIRVYVGTSCWDCVIMLLVAAAAARVSGDDVLLLLCGGAWYRAVGISTSYLRDIMRLRRGGAVWASRGCRPAERDDCLLGGGR